MATGAVPGTGTPGKLESKTTKVLLERATPVAGTQRSSRTSRRGLKLRVLRVIHFLQGVNSWVQQRADDRSMYRRQPPFSRWENQVNSVNTKGIRTGRGAGRSERAERRAGQEIGTLGERGRAGES